MTEPKHVAVFRQKHMNSGEEIVAWGEGYIGEMMGTGKDRQHNGALIVTNNRVAFYRKGMLGEVLETIPLKSITSIERKSLMGHCTIGIHTSHDALTFKTFQKPKEQELVNAIEQGRGNHAAPQATSNSPLDALKKLAELKDAGILTEAEFQSKKADLLSKI
jgi:hypothetical protein